MHEIVNAIIYLPRHISLDSMFAMQALAHIERRGYQLHSVVHRWCDAIRLTRTGAASVVVFARAEHYEPDFQPRIEFVGEDTIDLTRHGAVRPRSDRREAGDSRSRRPRITN